MREIASTRAKPKLISIVTVSSVLALQHNFLQAQVIEQINQNYKPHISPFSLSSIVFSLSKGLSLCFMCSDQHVKYRKFREFFFD